MPKVFVYDSYDNKFFRYYLSENDPMPYSTGTTLRVREFRGASKGNVLWTTTAAMEAWNLTRRTYGSGIPVGYAFRRIWEGGHGTTSQHYAGVAFDVGQRTTAANRRKIYNAAVATGAWGYSTNKLDGIFGQATESALKGCQRRFGLTADGVCGCASWKKIAEATVGIGRTATVIDK